MSFKRNYFAFDGKASTAYGAYIATSNAWDGAVHDDETIEIPGRNGALIYDNGRYKNFTMEVECYMPHDMQTGVDGIRSYLSSKHGYCRYEEALKPGEYRMARYTGPFSLTASDRVGAAFTLSFDCKPQRFLTLGEVPVTFTATGTLYNPTEYEAKPMIRVYGTSGTVTANGVAVTVSGCTTYADIDCELMEVYEGSTNLNGSTTLTNGAFPTLSEGVNVVSFTGFTSVRVIPRWWRI